MSKSMRLGHVVALDRHLDQRALGAAQQLEDVVVGDRARHVLVVDLDDAVAGADAEAERRRALERRDDDELAVADLELDADARVVAVELVAERLVALGRHVDRVRVERLQHAVDRALDQLLVVERLDVLRADRFSTWPKRSSWRAQVVLRGEVRRDAEDDRDGDDAGDPSAVPGAEQVAHQVLLGTAGCPRRRPGRAARTSLSRWTAASSVGRLRAKWNRRRWRPAAGSE